MADPRRQRLVYRIFPSPVGHILIARSGLGVAALEFLERHRNVRASRLSLEPEIELVPDGQEIDRACQDLLDYFQGRRRRFEWPLDLRLARSEFHRSVLKAATAIPYGAVLSYAGLAREVGRASAVRAVAQALRRNPLPVVIPCHRVVGSSGALTGYAGSRLGLKRRLLSLEGVPTTGPKEAGQPAVQTQAMYAQLSGLRVYCLPSCPALIAIGPVPLMRIASRASAEEAGLSPCRLCRPDLNPLPRNRARAGVR